MPSRPSSAVRWGVAIENLLRPAMCVGYGDRVDGRPPRTVCRNGGPVSPAVGTGPYFHCRSFSGLQRGCADIACIADQRPAALFNALGCDAVLASHPKPRTRNPPKLQQLRARLQWGSKNCGIAENIDGAV